ncbi:MAG: protein kinase [Pseudomonadota bacterium]
MKKHLIENRYECLRKIGEGGMASVYEAQDRKLYRRVAVKILHEHMQNSRDLRKRFIKEAHSVSKLRHANILEIYDFSGESSKELWVVTELIDGVDLSRYLKDFENRRINPYIATCIVREISIALHESHSHGIIHRDIKPSNIMITKSGRIKLMDFGIAKDMATGDMTQTGTFMGSPSYMSPEQIRGSAVTSSSDLYSLCVLYYELVTGSVPFKGSHAAEIITKIIEDDPMPPKDICPEIMPSINEFILKGLEKKPSSRYLNAMDVEEKLEQILKSAGFGDSRVEMEQLFRQPKVYQEKLRRLNESAISPSGEKTTEPKKIDAPKPSSSKPSETVPNDRGPYPLKVERPHYKNIPKATPSAYALKKESSSGTKFGMILMGILIALLIPILWLSLDKIQPWGIRGIVDVKGNRPVKEGSPKPNSNKTSTPTSTPTATSAPKVPSEDSPNEDPKQKTKPQTKPNTGSDYRETSLSQKPPLRETPPIVAPPTKIKVKKVPRAKALPPESKPTDSKINEPTATEPRPRPNQTNPPRETLNPPDQSLPKKGTPGPKALEKGTLSISSTSEGRLFLNGIDYGLISGHEKSILLPAGGYEVKVVKEGFKSALGMAKLEGGRTTKLLSLKLEKEKEPAPLYKLTLTTSSPQVLIQVSSIHLRESVNLSNSKKTLSLPAGSYVVKAVYKGKTLERTIILPSPYDADGSITFNAEFE